MESIISQIVSKFKLGRRGESGGALRNFRFFLINFFWGILVIMLLILCFFLGRLTKFMENPPTFTFESKESEEQNYNLEKSKLLGLNSNLVSTSTIVASKGGKKYYFVWCKGAANLKESNKRYFASEDLAKKAGYTRANNCK